jgi:hypothetical protein
LKTWVTVIGLLDGSRLTPSQLSKLVDSPPDEISPLSGQDLIRRKVRELVVMGGDYPRGREYNFFGDSSAASARVVNTWASERLSPVTYAGLSLGLPVLSGSPLIAGLAHDADADARADEGERLRRGPSSDPVAHAYRWYTYGAPRESWDPLAVLYAIEGTACGGGRVFEYANKSGYNSVDAADGTNAWVEDPARTDQHWLRLCTSSEQVAAALDRMYLRGAWRAYDEWRAREAGEEVEEKAEGV